MLTHNQALVRATARSAFWQRYVGMPSIMDNLFQAVDSDADQESYPGLFYAPGPREMTGSRDHRTVPGFDFTIKNKKWESTVDLAYETVKFAKLGSVGALLGSMGDKARKYPHKLMADLMNVGDAAASLGNDGQIFYSSSAHVDPGAAYTTTQDNDFTSVAATGTVPTDLEMRAALRSHLTAFHGFKDGDGDPAGPDENAQFVVLCSAENYPVAQAVYKNDQLTGPIGNELQGVFRPVLNQYSDVDAEFFTFWTNGPRKSFIYQTAEAVSLTDNMGGDSEFETKDVSFGSFGYYNVGYGDWRTTCRHIFA